MGKKQRITYEAIIAKPDRKNIAWDDFIGLILFLGGTVKNQGGSAHGIKLNGQYAVFHRPHPGNVIYTSQLKRIRRFLENAGIDHME